MEAPRIAAWDRPVLQSVAAMVGDTRHVVTDREAVERVARWMAFEPFAPPEGGPEAPFDWGDHPDGVIDAVMLKASIDFAFTDFATGVKFETEYLGRVWSDSEAMYGCLHRSWTEGEPVLDGEYLARVDAAALDRIFRGTIPMPMLDERAEVLNSIGAVLVDRFQGRFHNFIRSCAPAMYAGGEGLLERLTVEFPRFDDRSDYQGRQVVFHKLAQLALWSLHLSVGPEGGIVIRDLDGMTAFADYIVPLGLELMGILRYTPELGERIAAGDEVRRDSAEEVEIRAHTLYATALLTDAINRIRAPQRALIIPEIDYRLWSTYHAAPHPHHLTRTVMY
ncbi:MAG TPA: queuosine salvage family protein [Acidimicrobiia bacterium]|nr:queuosine salvage family protein [Acidimicrobiia bacterium]